MTRKTAVVVALLFCVVGAGHSNEGQRARDLGIEPGILQPGPLNAITDVAGVKVGHRTLIEGAYHP